MFIEGDSLKEMTNCVIRSPRRASPGGLSSPVCADGTDVILDIISLIRPGNKRAVRETFSSVVQRALSAPEYPVLRGRLLLGEPDPFNPYVHNVFIVDVRSGKESPPGLITFDEAVNLKTAAEWSRKRGNEGVIADIFFWLFIHKNFFLGEDEITRRKQLLAAVRHPPDRQMTGMIRRDRNFLRKTSGDTPYADIRRCVFDAPLQAREPATGNADRGGIKK